MPAALGQNGVQVLKDARTRSPSATRRDLVGIQFWTKRQADIATLTRDSAPMTILPHDPRGSSKPPRSTSRSSFRHARAARSYCRWWRGSRAEISDRSRHAVTITTTLFVSRGVGTIYVPAGSCPPSEVAVLTLQPA
jgi:hypothetical protein